MFIYVLRITIKQFLNLKYLNPEDSVQLTEYLLYISRCLVLDVTKVARLNLLTSIGTMLE